MSGTAEYALPTDLLDVMRVAHNGLKIEGVSQYELDVLYNSDWTDDTGTPAKYYIDLDPNNKKIHLFPIPTAGDAGTNNLVIEYLKIPPTLTNDSSVPFDSHTLLAPYHDAISYGAASSLLMIRPDQAALVMVGAYEKKYGEYVEKCIEKFRGMGDERPINIYRGRNPSNLGR